MAFASNQELWNLNVTSILTVTDMSIVMKEHADHSVESSHAASMLSALLKTTHDYVNVLQVIQATLMYNARE